ncbi:MAG TPA: hypothetical protein VGL81_23640 [Polyangiaceae bacterium]|jgi:tetratricopeptide (TPR) repeat protein
MRTQALSTRASTALVLLVALAVHARTVAFGFTGLDDRDLIVGDQAFLAAPANLLRVFGRSYLHVVDPAHAYWRPLVTASYVLDAQWSGAQPWGYHATNVVLYAIASALVLALLRRFGLGRGVALAGALVFAVHPALASAVAWIPGRNDSLLAVMALASWVLLRERRWAAHLVFFALALMTKETALALPVLWGVELVGGQGRRERARWLVAAGWLALVAARFLVHPGAPHATAAELLANLPVVPIALGKLVLPVKPTVLAVVGDLSVWPGAAAAVALAVAAWRLPRARRRVLAFGALAFLLFLAPALAVPGTLVLDQRFVLPALGVLVVAGEIVRALRPEPRVLAAFAGVGVAALALVTVGFEGSFREPLAFAREAVAGSPRSPLAHFCLGQVEQRAGKDDRALVEYRTALSLGPAEVVHNDIAVIAMKDGHWADAEAELRAELALNPGYATAEYNLAIVLRREGRRAEACDAVKRAVGGSLEGDLAATRERDRDCAP